MHYYMCINGINVTLILPDGFKHDKRSTPKIAWSFKPRDGRSEIAAIIHDGLYRSKGCRIKKVGVTCNCYPDKMPVIFDRKACDQTYKEVYKITAPEKEKDAKRDYFWLRLFGALYFGKGIPNE